MDRNTNEPVQMLTRYPTEYEKAQAPRKASLWGWVGMMLFVGLSLAAGLS